MSHHLKTIAGSIAVYFIVAACSANTNTDRHAGAGATGGTTSATGGAGGLPGGAGGTVLDSGLDALADALGDAMDAATDPVPDADAAPMPTIVNVPCDIRFGTNVQRYAEAQFPGKLASELVHVVAVANWGSVLQPKDLGYSKQVLSFPMVADGKVAIPCASGATFPDSVDFILP